MPMTPGGGSDETGHLELRPRSGRYAATPWARQRLYRPFVFASLAVALTFGFTVGATMLVWAAAGSPGVSWVTHLQPHGVAQIFGFAGLFVMGISMHVVPRFRGDAPVRYPWPQRAMLALVLGGIVLRAFGQALYRREAGGVLLVASGVALLAGVVVFAVTLAAVLRAGRPGAVRVERWLWSGLAWAVAAAALHLWITVDMAGGSRVAADAALDEAFVWAGMFGFVAQFIFGVSRRAVAGFLALRPARTRLESAAWTALNGGVALLVVAQVAGWEGAAPAARGLVAAGLLAFVVALRILEPPARPRAVGPGSYPRFGWFLVAAYAWLAVAGAVMLLDAVREAAGLDGLPATALPAVHTVAVGFITMMIAGFAARVLPLFEGRFARRTRHLDAAFVALNLSVAMRLGFGLGAAPMRAEALAVSGVLGLAGLACFAWFAWGALRPLARANRADAAIPLTPVAARGADVATEAAQWR